MRKYLSIALVLLLALAVASCKSHSSVSSDETAVEMAVRVDTVYIHDTIYVDISKMPKGSVEKYSMKLESALIADFSPLYDNYKEITADNLATCKALYQECSKKAEATADSLKAAFLAENPDEDQAAVSSSTVKALSDARKPYLHMMNAYAKK